MPMNVKVSTEDAENKTGALEIQNPFQGCFLFVAYVMFPAEGKFTNSVKSAFLLMLPEI